MSGCPKHDNALAVALSTIAQGRKDNGRPLAAETARQLARSALIENGLDWMHVLKVRDEMQPAFDRLRCPHGEPSRAEGKQETTMHPSTFEYLKPTDSQVLAMGDARAAAHGYARALEVLVPDGPDKTYIMRKLREVAMWVNIAITLNPDGTPRS